MGNKSSDSEGSGFDPFQRDPRIRKGVTTGVYEVFVHAKGFAGELGTQLYIAKSFGYIDEKTFDEFIDKAKCISSLIANLIKYLRRDDVSTLERGNVMKNWRKYLHEQD